MRVRLRNIGASALREAGDQAFQHLNSLPAFQQARVIFTFVSTPEEIDTHRLIDTCLASGKVVLIPKIVDRTTMVAVEFPGWNAMQPGKLNILSPPPTSSAWRKKIDGVVVPGTGFSGRGDRIGYGGGYYDRWLSANVHDWRFGFGHQCQIDSAIVSEPHDVRLHGVVTNESIINGLCDIREM